MRSIRQLLVCNNGQAIKLLHSTEKTFEKSTFFISHIKLASVCMLEQRM